MLDTKMEKERKISNISIVKATIPTSWIAGLPAG
jgi:hypothetical protein